MRKEVECSRQVPRALGRIIPKPSTLWAMVARARPGCTHLRDAGPSTHYCPQYPPRRMPGGGRRVIGGGAIPV